MLVTWGINARSTECPMDLWKFDTRAAGGLIDNWEVDTKTIKVCSREHGISVAFCGHSDRKIIKTTKKKKYPSYDRSLTTDDIAWS